MMSTSARSSSTSKIFSLTRSSHVSAALARSAAYSALCHAIGSSDNLRLRNALCFMVSPSPDGLPASFQHMLESGGGMCASIHNGSISRVARSARLDTLGCFDGEDSGQATGSRAVPWGIAFFLGYPHTVGCLRGTAERR